MCRNLESSEFGCIEFFHQVDLPVQVLQRCLAVALVAAVCEEQEVDAVDVGGIVRRADRQRRALQ